MDELQMEQIAHDNIGRHLGDVVTEDMDGDDIKDECYTLAFDALVDAGVDAMEAGTVARKIARQYAD